MSDALVPIKKVIDKILRDEEGWAKNPSNIRGFSTGFNSLNDITAGWSEGEMIVLMAYTSVGKSALANQWIFEAVQQLAAETVARKAIAGKVVVFSPEMTGEQIFKRQASVWSGVSSWDIFLGRSSYADRQRWRNELVKLRGFEPFLQVYAGESMDVTYIEQQVTELFLQDVKPRIIFVDYIQRVDGEGSSKFATASEASRCFKNIANKYGIPVIALSQVTANDGDESKMPTIYQIRDSKDIIQDADKVLILHRLVRDEKNEKASKTPSKLKLAKNRHGPLGTVDLVYYHKAVKFEEFIDQELIDDSEGEDTSSELQEDIWRSIPEEGATV